MSKAWELYQKRKRGPNPLERFANRNWYVDNADAIQREGHRDLDSVVEIVKDESLDWSERLDFLKFATGISGHVLASGNELEAMVLNKAYAQCGGSIPGVDHYVDWLINVHGWNIPNRGQG